MIVQAERALLHPWDTVRLERARIRVDQKRAKVRCGRQKNAKLIARSHARFKGSTNHKALHRAAAAT